VSKGACGKARCQVANSAFTNTNLAVFEVSKGECVMFNCLFLGNNSF
jgi:hypothetical protein